MRHIPRRMARDSAEGAWRGGRSPERVRKDGLLPHGGRGVGLEDGRQGRDEGAGADRSMAAALAGQVGCTARALSRFIVAAVVCSSRRGVDTGRRLRHRAAGCCRHDARQRLRREGKRDQEGEEYPERTHVQVCAGPACPVKASLLDGRDGLLDARLGQTLPQFNFELLQSPLRFGMGRVQHQHPLERMDGLVGFPQAETGASHGHPGFWIVRLLRDLHNALMLTSYAIENGLIEV